MLTFRKHCKAVINWSFRSVCIRTRRLSEIQVGLGISHIYYILLYYYNIYHGTFISYGLTGAISPLKEVLIAITSSHTWDHDELGQNCNRIERVSY
jgi:hypothetical protein